MSATRCQGCKYYAVQPSKIYRGLVAGCIRQDWDKKEDEVNCAYMGRYFEMRKRRGKDHKK